MVLLGAFVAWQASGIGLFDSPSAAGVFPLAAGLVMAGAALVAAIGATRRGEGPVLPRDVAAVGALVLLYMAGLEALGFVAWPPSRSCCWRSPGCNAGGGCARRWWRRARWRWCGWCSGWGSRCCCRRGGCSSEAARKKVGGGEPPPNPHPFSGTWRRPRLSVPKGQKKEGARGSSLPRPCARDRPARVLFAFLDRPFAAGADRARHLRRHLYRRHSGPVGDDGGGHPDLLHLHLEREPRAGADRRRLYRGRVWRQPQRGAAQHPRRAGGDRHRARWLPHGAARRGRARHRPGHGDERDRRLRGHRRAGGGGADDLGHRTGRGAAGLSDAGAARAAAGGQPVGGIARQGAVLRRAGRGAGPGRARPDDGGTALHLRHHGR